MRLHLRKIVKDRKNKEQFSLNLPIEIVKELKLRNSHVILEVKGNTLLIKKINE